MINSNSLFLVVIFIAISVAVFAKQYNKRRLYIIAKPFTMLMIIALPLLDGRDEYSAYAYLIVTALVLSLLGDLFLLFPDKYFNNGLYAFLSAHLIYIVAFNTDVKNYNYTPVIPIIIYLFFIVRKLLPVLGNYKYPVLFYILVISGMLFSAINMEIYLHQSISYLSLGAVLFVISDTTLALNKFYKKNSFAEVIILTTYFLAQLFFALTI